ncbi:tetratricopeptide repeat protein [Parvularcula sp. ZS-1/3]|uniref:Tetratricopeptide repeat protein n=1 Tax=Parvularcula mediterranea TaxID=2732508 RepID=A0A7Y3RLK1_9PROT|nr:tetratricopeptide repeat protein [Parvularcula mediterranea]NNU16334.1 tetratricopeptide repeat protein [Parvularcula mediterranea]
MLGRFMSEIRRRRVLNLFTPYLVAVWLVIQIVVAIGPTLGFPDWIATLVVVASIVGVPAAFYVAWFFDFTSEGVVRTPSRERAEVIEPLGPAHYAGLAATLLFAALAGWLSFGIIVNRTDNPPTASRSIENKSVAVMPFDDLSPTQELNYLAQGLAEEITVALGKLGNIRISAPSSAFRATEQAGSAVEIGRLLNVGAILQGSVRLAGDQLRVTASLVSTSDGLTIWSDAFSRSLSESVLMEEQIARSILGIMLDRFLTDEDEILLDRPNAADAYQFYLRGREKMRIRTAESLGEARAFFEQTIAADPEYAPGYAGLAAVLLLLGEGTENFGTIDKSIAAQLATANGEKALLRQPNLAEAHAVMGRAAAFRGEGEAALAAYDKAIAINPSYADAHLWKSNLLSRQGDLDGAAASLEDAFKLDPLSPVILYNKGFQQVRRGRFAEAKAFYETLLDLEPNSPLGHRGLADVARRQGDLASSAKAWKRALDNSPNSVQYRESLVGALLTLEAGEAARLFASPDYETNLRIAAGDFDGAIEKVRFDYAASPDDAWMAFEAGWTELLYGDEERAYDALIRSDAALGEEDQFAMPYCSPAIEAAWALRQRGAEQEAAARIERCRAAREEALAGGQRSIELDYLGARLAALGGNEIEAVRLLTKAYEGGWREPWSAHDPLLRPGGETDGRVSAVLDEIAKDLARQRLEIASEIEAWKASAGD